MWESKDQTLDVNYNTDHIWFDGINGLPVQKPAEIRKWEESKCHKLVEKTFPRVKADKMLTDLSSIALEWAKTYVRQRQTFKLNTKGENMAPLAFQQDPDGTYLALAIQLRNAGDASSFLDPDDDGSSVLIEPIDGNAEDSFPGKGSKTERTPPVRAKVPATPANAEEQKFRKQKALIDDWVADARHPATDTCRHILELYAQLNDSEFSYVSDLHLVYDEARCFFLQWILGKEIKELVNSARISAIQAGNKFTWKQAKAEVLRSLTDVTLTARFLALARLRRQQGTTAKLWVSQVMTRKALLEDVKLDNPITLPESLYLEILVGQMSAQETTVFEGCPAIGDNLSAVNARGAKRFTLEKIKHAIDACSNPPYFRGVKTPITDLLDLADPKPAKEKRDQTKNPTNKDSKARSDAKTPANTQKTDKPYLARRPTHEQPAKFPDGLKRPDLEAVVDGHKIASDAQRQLYDDIKRGNCTRCHKGGPPRKDCKETKEKWEDKFDKEGTQY